MAESALWDSFDKAPAATAESPLWDEFDKSQPQGGFKAAAKQAIGVTIKGAGQAAADFIPGVGQDNPVKKYGQSVVDANPTIVQNLSDIWDHPFKAATEATGNAAGSMAGMLGARVVGTGITAASPLAGPLAPVVAAIGQAVSWLGPAAMAALPSFSGIRDQQILDDPQMEQSGKAKAIAALGASAVGAIEVAFGPQQWALAAMTREGRAQIAEKFAAATWKQAAAKGLVEGSLVEGGEELVQNPIEQAASFQNPLTPENLQQTAFGGAMGAIGGGVLGGAAGGLLHSKPAETPTPAVTPTPAPDPITAAVATVDPGMASTVATVVDAPDEINQIIQAATVAAQSPFEAPADLPIATTGPATIEQRIGLIAQDAAAMQAEAQKQRELDALQTDSQLPAALETANTADTIAERSGLLAEPPTAMQLAMQRAREKNPEQQGSASVVAPTQAPGRSAVGMSDVTPVPTAALPDQAKAQKASAETPKHEFASTQVALPTKESTQIKSAAKSLIAPADIDPEHGLEDRPHITVKYGLHTADVAAVQKAVANHGPVTAKVTGIEIFKPEGKDYEVVVARVDSADLTKLNKQIGDAVPHTDTFPDYKPHITLGYVKRGTGNKYADAKTGLEGKSITMDTIELTDQNEKITPIKLGPVTALGKPVASLTEKELKMVANRGKTPEMRAAAKAEIQTRALSSQTPAIDKLTQNIVKPVRARDRKNTPSGKLLRLIDKLGGIQNAGRLGGAADILGERNAIRHGGMVGRIFRRTGQPLDQLAAALHERGWITDAEFNDVDGGVQRVRDMIQAAAHDQLDPVLAEDVEAAHVRQMEERQAAEAARAAGLEPTPEELAEIEEVANALAANDKAVSAIMADAESGNIAYAEALASIRKVLDEDNRPAAEDIRSSANSREAAQAESNPREATADAESEVAPPLELEQQTPQDLKAKAARESDPKAAARADIKREAELGANHFALTSDVKPESVAAAEFKAAQSSLIAPQKPALSAITVRTKNIEAETGNEITMDEQADVALLGVDAQITKVRALLTCLRS